MFKKIDVWIVLLLVIIFFICTILFGGILRYHYVQGGTNFPKLRTLAVFIADIPTNFISIYRLGRPEASNKKNATSPVFERFIKTERNTLLVLPRYDGDLKRSIVEIIDLDTFEVLHTYKHNIDKMNDLIDLSNVEHERAKIDDSETRFEYRHPLILEDGSLIADSDYAPLFKIDFCSNLMWLNQEERFHHSKMLDKDGNIWVGAQMFPYSDFIKEHKHTFGFSDDAIAKVNKDGEILFIKSVLEILSENKILSPFLFQYNDPIHLNDIEPAFENSNYWLEGDLFISILRQSAIIHYRPSTNEVINYIQGPFFHQHDVDIISDKEISIFNNNSSILKNNKYSEVIIYNFETNTFSKKFNKQLQKENFKTFDQGLSEILKDGSMLVEEQNAGTLIFFNKDGEKEWKYVNKDSNNDIYFISWSRIIENNDLIKKIKNKKKTSKCTNL